MINSDVHRQFDSIIMYNQFDLLILILNDFTFYLTNKNAYKTITRLLKKRTLIN